MWGVVCMKRVSMDHAELNIFAVYHSLPHTLEQWCSKFGVRGTLEIIFVFTRSSI
jgi:hypothetical protein